MSSHPRKYFQNGNRETICFRIAVEELKCGQFNFEYQGHPNDNYMTFSKNRVGPKVKSPQSCVSFLLSQRLLLIVVKMYSLLG